jgi:hypothetical protein
VDYLIWCTCGHSAEFHSHENASAYRGCQKDECACPLARSEVIDAAIADVRTEWAGKYLA